MLPLVPAEPPEHAQVCSQLLLSVVPESVLQRAEVLVRRDGRCWIGPGQVRLHRLSIHPHVCVIAVEEQPRHALALRNPTMAQLKLAILPICTAERPVQIDAVGDDGHCKNSVAQAPVEVVIFNKATYRVAARIRRVVPRAVVIHRPVHELQMAVRRRPNSHRRSPAASSCPP